MIHSQLHTSQPEIQYGKFEVGDLVQSDNFFVVVTSIGGLTEQSFSGMIVHKYLSSTVIGSVGNYFIDFKINEFFKSQHSITISNQ